MAPEFRPQEVDVEESWTKTHGPRVHDAKREVDTLTNVYNEAKKREAEALVGIRDAGEQRDQAEANKIEGDETPNAASKPAEEVRDFWTGFLESYQPSVKSYGERLAEAEATLDKARTDAKAKLNFPDQRPEPASMRNYPSLARLTEEDLVALYG